MQCTVTGASGFIGRALTPLLERKEFTLSRWERSDPRFDLGAASGADVSQLWIDKLRGSEVLVHLAGAAHNKFSDAALRAINTDGAANLAAAALAAGVRRFIFISSAKVFGEGDDGPYAQQSPAHPQDIYAKSKWAAEQRLRQLTANSPMELVIIRPPLVYGSQAGANFARLRQLAGLRLPLPFAGVHNRRAMIGIDNLLDFILHCIESPAASDNTWLCSDNKPYSLAETIATIRAAEGRKPRLFSLPQSLLDAIATPILGGDNCRRLFGNFEIDIGTTRSALNWSPPYTMLEILQDRCEK